MKKYIITGFSGFVARHFIDYLENNRIKSKVLGLDICAPMFKKNYNYVDWKFEQINLLEKKQLESTMLKFRPDYILHLASFSSVAFSWMNPVASFMNNTNIFLNILEAVRKCNIKCRILSIGSSEEYGNVGAKQVPLSEKMTLAPVSPYAVARVSQESLSKVYFKGYGLDIVMTRSFNHVGPGQSDIFVVSSFSKQIVSLSKSGKKQGSIVVGNVDITRDFLDVRDVVVAYYKLFERGRAGEVYNVCSGEGSSLRDIIRDLAKINGIKIKLIVDNKLMRPDDNKIIIGDNTKIVKQLNWQPRITLKKSLSDISDYWRDYAL